MLCSPLQRARETCELAGFGDVAELDDDLHEWDYGDYEGLTTPEIRARDPDWNLWRDGCPGGETPGRDRRARRPRAGAACGAVDGDALAFAHGHILRVLTARWLRDGGRRGGAVHARRGRSVVLGHERETEVIERWNANH